MNHREDNHQIGAGNFCKCATRCPVFVKLVAWLMLIIGGPGLISGFFTSVVELPTNLQNGSLALVLWVIGYGIVIVSAMYMLKGRKWAYILSFVLTFPTLILPLLLLLQHQEYDDFVAYQKWRRLQAHYFEP